MARVKAAAEQVRFPVEKPSGPLVIDVGLQGDGAVYELSSKIETWLEEAFPGADRISTVFLTYRNKRDFERTHGLYWECIALMLTGLTGEQLREFGGIRIHDPAEEREWTATLRSNHR